MSALETIEAAIDHLEHLKGNGTETWMTRGRRVIAESIYSGEGKLNAALHPTLDAQLAILRSAHDRIKVQTVKGRGKYQVAWSVDRDALNLANAILGIAA